MYVDNLQQKIHNCQETIYTSLMSNYDALRFGRFLEEAYRNSPFKSHSELAKAAGMTRSTVSSLISAKPQSATSKPSRPKENTVVQLAETLGIDVDEALLAAGHAPRETAPFLSIGDKAQVKLLTPNLSDDERQEIADELSVAYEVIMARRALREDKARKLKI